MKTAYCCECDAEATAMTAMGTPLCETHRRAYGIGQWHKTARIEHREILDYFEDESDLWCELCDDETTAYAHGAFDRDRKRICLCASCLGAFEMGQASPDAAVYTLDDVRFKTDKIGSHTITANFDGFAWKEVSHVADTVAA